MGPDRLDKFIKGKVFDHQTATDTDALWEGILAKQAVDEEPKRRFAWWWFMAGLVVIIGIASYLVFAENETNNEDFNNISNKSINKDFASKKEETNESLGGLNTNSNNRNTADIDANIDADTKMALSTTVMKNNKQKPLASASVKNRTSLSNKSEISKVQIKSKKQAINTSDNNDNFNTDQHSGHPNNNTFSKNKTNNKPPTINKTQDLSSTKTISTTSPNRFKKESHNNLTTNFNLQSLLAQIDNDLLPILTTDEKLQGLAAPPIQPEKKPSPFSIGFAFGYGFAKKQLTNNIQGEDASEYIRLREESETPMQVISGGVDLAYQFRAGFYAKTGLQYEQITERFDYSKTTATPFFNDTAVAEVYYQMNGSIEKETGTESMKVRTQSRKIYNRYRTLDIPLTIGYQPITKNKLNWFVEGGVLINLVFAPRGEVLDYNGEEIIDLSSTDYLKKNIGLSLTAGAGLSYRVTKRWSVWASPKFRMPLTGMTEQEYLVDQRFFRGVVEVGGRFGF